MNQTTPQEVESVPAPVPPTSAQLIAIGLGHHQSGRFPEAKETYLQVLAAEPENFDALHLLGVLAHQVGKHDIAVDLIEKAVRQNDQNPVAFNNLGEAYKGMKRLDEAERCYRRALSLKPDFVEVSSNLGNALKDQGRLEEAEELFRQALSVKPDFLLARYNLGYVLQSLGEFDEAEATFVEIVTQKPDHVDAAENLARLRLMRGEYSEGARFFEDRFNLAQEGAPQRVQKQFRLLQGRRRWRGESLKGLRLMVITEPGAGDNLMMMRYLPLLKQFEPARVVVYSTPHLARIFQEMACVDEVVPMTERVPFDSFDLFAPMFSFPYHFQTTLDTIPERVPYLPLPKDAKKLWRTRMEDLPGVKVGLTWGAGRLSPTGKKRSVPLELFMPLLDVPDLQLVSLQKGKEADQLKGLGWDVLDFMGECQDFLDTACLVEQLDLVISVDTSVAHLAGALGKPVWLLNCFESEWRWMVGREDSRWYPSMRIFRQSKRGVWEGVIEEIVAELPRFIKNP